MRGIVRLHLDKQLEDIGEPVTRLGMIGDSSGTIEVLLQNYIKERDMIGACTNVRIQIGRHWITIVPIDGYGVDHREQSISGVITLSLNDEGKLELVVTSNDEEVVFHKTQDLLTVGKLT